MAISPTDYEDETPPGRCRDSEYLLRRVSTFSTMRKVRELLIHWSSLAVARISLSLQNVADHIALGYSTFPWDYKTMPSDDGIILAWTTLPGGTYPDANLGKTLVHEVGHWGGLLHTFTVWL